MLSERLFIKGRKSLNLYPFYKFFSSLHTATQYPTSGYPSGEIPPIGSSKYEKRNSQLITFSPLYIYRCCVLWGLHYP